jgi:hypothetical protein
VIGVRIHARLPSPQSVNVWVRNSLDFRNIALYSGDGESPT